MDSRHHPWGHQSPLLTPSLLSRAAHCSCSERVYPSIILCPIRPLLLLRHQKEMIRPPAIHQSSLRDSVLRPLIPDACNLLRPSTDNQSFVQQKIGLSSLRGILQHFRLTRISRPRYHLHDDRRELFCWFPRALQVLVQCPPIFPFHTIRLQRKIIVKLCQMTDSSPYRPVISCGQNKCFKTIILSPYFSSSWPSFHDKACRYNLWFVLIRYVVHAYLFLFDSLHFRPRVYFHFLLCYKFVSFLLKYRRWDINTPATISDVNSYLTGSTSHTRVETRTDREAVLPIPRMPPSCNK